MNVRTYVIEHDVGFAPNPFHGCCTLANCKPRIRQAANVNDIILGFGSAKYGYAGLLVYWMKVDRIITFDEYWNEYEFIEKRPVVNAGLMLFHGDNIYHTNKAGGIEQSFSFHSNEDGSLSIGNLNRDTGRTNRVLISKTYAYYGRKAVNLPDHLKIFIKKGIGERFTFPQENIDCLIQWIDRSTQRGFIGTPIDWKPIKILR